MLRLLRSRSIETVTLIPEITRPINAINLAIYGSNYFRRGTVCRKISAIGKTFVRFGHKTALGCTFTSHFYILATFVNWPIDYVIVTYFTVSKKGSAFPDFKAESSFSKMSFPAGIDSGTLQ